MHQESTVLLGDQQVTVSSTVLLDPEVLITTTITTADGRQLRKSHTPVPPAAVAEFEENGPSALTSTLQTSHLRYIQRLLSTPRRDKPQRSAPSPTSGVLATQVIDASGRVVRSMGEEQVPGNWLQTGFLLTTMASEIGETLGLGRPTWCVAEGEGICLAMTVDPDGVTGEIGDTKICYVDPREVSTERAKLGGLMEAV